MSAAVQIGSTACAPAARLRRVEEWLVTAILLAMMLLPLVDRLLLGVHKSIGHATSVVEHLTLALSMLGGLLAARSDRLISISSLACHLTGVHRWIARMLSHAVAAIVAVALARAGLQFVAAERDFGSRFLPGVPLWFVECIIPVGFLLIAVRLALRAAHSWRERLAMAALVIAGSALTLAPWDPVTGRSLGLGALLLAAVYGAPLFAIIGGAALLLMAVSGQPVAAMAVKHYSLATTPAVATIPLFALAGYFLAEGGAARRLVGVCDALFGHIRGGAALATVLACAFFTTFTGASGVTILALGGLLLPALTAAGCRERDAIGLVTGTGAIGLLFPPCLPVILYSIVAMQALQNFEPALLGHFDISMEGMFQGALLPGLLLLAMATWWGVRITPQRNGHTARRFDAAIAWRAIREAKWELALPLVALGSLFGGLTSSPVQAAALTALYALVVEAFVYRDLNLKRDLARIAGECGLLIGGILLILGVAMGLTSYFVTEEIPDRLVNLVTAHVHAQWLFLLVLNVFLLIVGCLMDIYSAIVVIVPLIVPLALSFGIDPVHLGVIFLANLELGFLTPPVGMNLFLSSARFGKSVGDVASASWPMIVVLAAGVIAITYLPALTHWLPHLLATP